MFIKRLPNIGPYSEQWRHSDNLRIKQTTFGLWIYEVYNLGILKADQVPLPLKYFSTLPTSKL